MLINKIFVGFILSLMVLFGFIVEKPDNQVKLIKISPSNEVIDVDNRIDAWKGSRAIKQRFRRRFIYEKFKNLWFDITFELDLDDRSIILIKTIFEETFKNARKASSEFERGIIAHKFNKEVRKIIGEKNYDKLLNKREGRMPEKYNFGKTRYIKHE